MYIAVCMTFYVFLKFVGSTVIISLEQSSYFVNESSGFAEVCVLFEGLGVVHGAVTVNVFTQMGTATGKPTMETSDTIRLVLIAKIQIVSLSI